MDSKKIEEAAKALEGLSYHDWQKIKMSVELVFAKKKGEFEWELKLSSGDEIVKTIHQQFG